MNFRIVLRLLGIIGFVVAGCMSLPLACSLWYRDGAWTGILAAMAAAFAASGGLFAAGKSSRGDVFRRESIAVVALSWLLAAALGALPYLFTGAIADPVDAYFDTMSGFTTTGSTILRKISDLPPGLHLWRCFTQWLGGMGIVVLFVAIIPFLRASGKQLFFNEVPGPLSESLHPRVRDTALVLWKIYAGFSVILTVLLMLQGMSLFEAVCHTCAAMSTGGFSPRDGSIGEYGSPGIELTLIAFMLFASINFGIYFRLLRGDWRILFRNAELRFFLLIVLVATGAMAVELYFRSGRGFVESLRVAGFQSVSVITTTGFGTDDFDLWPSFSRSFIVVLMFVGGCAGSTAGGIKVVRILVLIKHALIETEHAFRPRTVRTLKVGSLVIEESTRWTILAFFAIVMGTMVCGTLFMAALGLDPVSAMTAVATTLNNVGPGLGTVGATESFADVPRAGKLFLSFCMVVGRLEVFSILVLLSPGMWRGR